MISVNPKQILDTVKSLSGDKGTADGQKVELPPLEGTFDRGINAVNRLGRPLLLVLSVAFFAWAIMTPTYFIIVMKALATTPEWVATILLTVVSAFVAGRVVRDFRKPSSMSTTISTTMHEQLDDSVNSSYIDTDDDIMIPPENGAIDAWKQR